VVSSEYAINEYVYNVPSHLWLEKNKYSNYSYKSLEVNLSKIADWDIKAWKLTCQRLQTGIL